MKRIIFSTFLLASLFSVAAPASAAWNSFSGYNNSGIIAGWSYLKIGGGGNVIHLDVQCDQGFAQCSPGVGTSTIISRQDTGSAWWYNKSLPRCGNASSGYTSGCWSQFITPAAFPVGLQNPAILGQGLRSEALAPSNTSHWYVYAGFGTGCIYYTTNKGTTFTQAATFTCTGLNSPNADQNREAQEALAVDPNNENVAYASSPGSNQCTTNCGESFVTTDGTDWSYVSSIPTSTLNGPITTIFAFDISNGTSGGKTKNVFACINGVGVYISVNAGSSWAELSSTGMPTACLEMLADPNGVLWINRDSSHVDRWVPASAGATSGTWTNPLGTIGNGGDAIAVDPANCTGISGSCRVVVMTTDGHTNVTLNGDASTPTWGGWNINGSTPHPIIAADVPYLSQIPGRIYSTSIVFDPTQSNVLLVSGGIGYFYLNPVNDNTTAYSFNSFTSGQEELVSNAATSPPGGNPLFGFWDEPVFVSQNPSLYPSTYGPSQCCVLQRGWTIDYATSNSSYVFAYIDGAPAYSTNGGGDGDPTNWANFTAIPIEGTIVNGSTPFGGSATKLAAQSPTNLIVSFGSGGDLFYTTDGTASWSQIAASGIPSSGVAITNTTSGMSATLTFPSSGAGALFSGTVTSINAGNTSTIRDVTASCNPGTASSATSTTIVLTTTSACSVTSGDYIQITVTSGTNWGATLCADRQTSGVYYAYSSGVAGTGAGVFKLYSGGASNVQVYSGLFEINGIGGLSCNPTTAGNLYWYSTPRNGILPSNTQDALSECTDSSPSGTSSGTMSCQAVATGNVIPDGSGNHYGVDVIDVWWMDLGKAKTGQPYPGILFLGACCASSNTDNTTMGYWITYDHFRTATKIGTLFAQSLIAGDTFPGNLNGSSTYIKGDMNTSGLFYIGTGPAGVLKARSNWLLNRDLDPASNDNSPAFLRKVA
jgi:hypothetical protein